MFWIGSTVLRVQRLRHLKLTVPFSFIPGCGWFRCFRYVPIVISIGICRIRDQSVHRCSCLFSIGRITVRCHIRSIRSSETFEIDCTLLLAQGSIMGPWVLIARGGNHGGCMKVPRKGETSTPFLRSIMKSPSDVTFGWVDRESFRRRRLLATHKKSPSPCRLCLPCGFRLLPLSYVMFLMPRGYFGALVRGLRTSI